MSGGCTVIGGEIIIPQFLTDALLAYRIKENKEE